MVFRPMLSAHPSSRSIRLGSKVSGAAMPPPIQRRMQVSAVALGCVIGSASSLGAPPAIVAMPAAESD